jgi:uncharacterized protein (DUF4415 family)
LKIIIKTAKSQVSTLVPYIRELSDNEVGKLRLKKQITIRLDNNTIEYFKELAKETGFSFQTLINLYLKDCAENRKKLRVQWIEPSF